MTVNVAKTWRCTVCGYIHEGDMPPDHCPVCGVPASEFEQVMSEVSVDSEGAKESEQGRILIAGAGIAGLSAAEAAREHAPEAEIVLLSTETEIPYYRLNLTRFLAGEISEDDLRVYPAEWYEEQRIDLKLGASLQRIDRKEKRIELQDGLQVSFDKLVVTTGAYPFIPPMDGTELTGVFSLRTANQARTILQSIDSDKKVVCIGGGILGLEMAGALARCGAKVTVLEAFDYLMPRQLNAAGSDVLQQHLGTLGIDVVKQALTAAIEGQHGSVSGVRLKDGRSVVANVVLIAVGVRSNSWMLEEAGLPTKGGVLVDNFMRTSDPDILAAGDVAEHDGMLYGSWAAAQYQGKIAGMNAAGVATEFGGIPRSHMLKILGKDMASIGKIKAEDGSDKMIDDLVEGNYRMFMLRDGRLVGALFLGDVSLMTAAKKAVESGLTVVARSAEKIAEELM